MILDIAVGHVAAKDVAEVVLIGAGDVGVLRLVFQFRAVGLSASHDELLLVDRQSFPLADIVLPLLQ